MTFDKLVKIKNFDGDIRMKIVSYVDMKDVMRGDVQVFDCEVKL